MAFGIPNNAANTAFAANVSARVRAETRITAGRAAFWYLLGLGAFAALAGVGVAAAEYGYSQIDETATSMDKMAAVLTKALERAQLHAHGEVSLSPDQKVALDTAGVSVPMRPGTVQMAPNSMVQLAPNSTVQIDGPPLALPQSEPRRSPTGKETTRSVTEFFSNDYINGMTVTTGWDYQNRDTSEPTRQFCYVAQAVTSVESKRFNIAVNGTLLRDIPQGTGIDFNDAFRYCTWHKT